MSRYSRGDRCIVLAVASEQSLNGRDRMGENGDGRGETTWAEPRVSATGTLVIKAQEHAEIAGVIKRLRQEAGLSQRALAELVGTTASVICRLEDPQYDGHSLAML